MRRAGPPEASAASDTTPIAREARRVIVGYDGSAPADAALCHAAERAGPAGRLLVVNAVEIPVGLVEGAWVTAADPTPERSAEELLERVDETELDVGAVERRACQGPAATALAELAESWDADEIVVGSRGRGRLGALLGSHSHSLLHVARRPVVVVPACATGGVAPEAGRRFRRARTVVLGWDGSDEAWAALRYAGRRVGRGGRLYAVYAYTPPSGWLGRPYYGAELADHQARGRACLRKLRDAVADDVGVETELLEGPPAEALVAVAAARGAGEIVVGSSRAGAIRALLGTVSHDLLHAADRPIVLVPS